MEAPPPLSSNIRTRPLSYTHVSFGRPVQGTRQTAELAVPVASLLLDPQAETGQPLHQPNALGKQVVLRHAFLLFNRHLKGDSRIRPAEGLVGCKLSKASASYVDSEVVAERHHHGGLRCRTEGRREACSQSFLVRRRPQACAQAATRHNHVLKRKNSEHTIPGMPLDEEQVERAVAFLLHPSVRGSADEAKRTFLANKGLDDAAIEEAYRRAGTAAASSSSSPADPSTAAQTHGTPPSAAFVPSYSYTSILLGLGFAGAAAYSLKTILGPSISRTVDSVRSALYPPTPPREGEDDIGGQRTDTRGVTIVEIDDEVDDAHAKRGALDAESTRELVEAIRELREEVRSLGDRLDGMAVGGAEKINGFADMPGDGISGTIEAPVGEEHTPMSYMQVLEMLEQGRPIPGIRDDIDDKPPNPDVSPTASALEWRAKPWEGASIQDDQDKAVEAGNGSSGTPSRLFSRRDISGSRPSSSIYESVTKSKAETKSPSPWKPPPLPSAALESLESLESPDHSNVN